MMIQNYAIDKNYEAKSSQTTSGFHAAAAVS